MRKAIIVGVLIVLSLPASARTVMAIAPEFGSIYCLQWTNLRKKGAGETDARVQWVIGYLAGWAATRDRSQKTVHPNEVNDVLTSIDHRCEVNPLSPVGWELQSFLRTRFAGKP